MIQIKVFAVKYLRLIFIDSHSNYLGKVLHILVDIWGNCFMFEEWEVDHDDEFFKLCIISICNLALWDARNNITGLYGLFGEIKTQTHLFLNNIAWNCMVAVGVYNLSNVVDEQMLCRIWLRRGRWQPERNTFSEVKKECCNNEYIDMVIIFGRI